MLLYLTNIGDILAKAFRYVYGKLCTCRPSGAQRRRRCPPQANHLQPNAENYRVHHIVSNAIDGGQEKLRACDEQVRIENLATGDEDIYEDGGSKPRVSVPITLCFVIMIGYISGGAVIFSLWEGWEFLDGSYFCFVTLSTIGFGDLVPGDTVVSDSGSQEKLVICSLYLLVGMALIAMCFNLMQEEVIYKVRNCGKRIGIIKDADDDEDFS
uniref:Putative potassium channel subfamily protein k member n=1 Tax=Amblyomma triste TaxID=251400 RepID=A0A023G3I2_AMBTT